MKRWYLDHPDKPYERSEYGYYYPVRYGRDGDQCRLTVYTHKISGEKESERIRGRIEAYQEFQEREKWANGEVLVDSAVDVVDQPFFPHRPGPGLYTVSEPVGSHSLIDYYNQPYRLMSWGELIAFCGSIVPVVASLHGRGIYHGNISSEHIFFKAGSTSLQQVILEELPLTLGCPYPFDQTSDSFPYTTASFMIRTREQLDPQKYGPPGPHTDIWQIATLLYWRRTGRSPLNISDAPLLREISDAICERKLRLDGLKEPLKSVFARALGVCDKKDRITTVKDFGREAMVATQECQENEKKPLRRVIPVPERIPRRAVLWGLVGGTFTLITFGAAAELKVMEGPKQSQPSVRHPASNPMSHNLPGGQFTTVVCLPDEKEFIVGSATGLLNTFALDRQEALRTLPLPGASLSGMALSADARSLVCYNSKGDVSQLEMQTGEVVKQARLSQDAHALALSGSGVLISAGGLVRFFAGALDRPWPANLPPDFQYEGHSSTVTGLAAVSDDLVASSSMDKTVQIWHPSTGERDVPYDKHAWGVLAVAAAATEVPLMASGDEKGFVEIWTRQGRVDGYRHKKAVKALAWSPDGQYLLSGGDDTLVQVYDTRRKQITPHHHHSESIVAVAWLNDKLVVTVSANQIYVWQAVA